MKTICFIRQFTVGMFLAALMHLHEGIAGSYTYDSLNRLTQASYSDGTVLTYTYDAAGNRLTQTGTGYVLDLTAPTNQITAPVSGLVVSNASYTVTGKASDNISVTNVLYQLNNGAWTPASSQNHWTNWTVGVTLAPGTNTISAFAVDSSGNTSATNTVTIVYVLSAVLTVNAGPGGSVVTNYNGALLQIGKTYSMTAHPNTGFRFAGWTGSTVTNGATLFFTMASNLVFNASFVDGVPPTNAITSPVAGQQWSNAVFTVTGKAGDNLAVQTVLYSLNGGGWSNAVTANNWTNWSAQVTLAPGTNTIAAYAVDNSGNVSPTNTVKLVYVLGAVLAVHVGPGGTVAPNYNGAFLQIGQVYSMTATTNGGFAFAGWTGSIVTNKNTLTFVMASNLVFNASFTDIVKPVLAIISPANNQRMTNALAFVKGTASDNWGVSAVWYQFNGNPWTLALTTNAYTNWTATLLLSAGTNNFKVCAVDLGGNYSTTNSLSVISSNTFRLQFSFGKNPIGNNGLTFNLLLSSNLNGHIQVSSNLATWTTLAGFTGTNSMIVMHDPAATNLGRRFYRAVIP